MMNLKELLRKTKKEFLANVSQDIIDAFDQATEELVKKNIEENALKVGGKLPTFILKNALRVKVDSNALLQEGPLVINFYRGGWWPYCNLELGSYQEILPQINDLGAQFIAISPELPDESLSIVEKNALKFEILSDIDNEVARNFGIVFSLNDNLKSIYKNFGIDLPKTQGNNKHELPVPATYVIDSDGTIILSHVDIDYTKRLEPEEVLEVLKNI